MSGFTVWLTGLSGAGKTTISFQLGVTLASNDCQPWLLDGDDWRKKLGRDLGFSKEDRDENIKRVSIVAAYLANSGHEVIASFISPYEKARRRAQNLHDRCLLVYVNCPLNVCEERDPKGLYKKARAGEIKEFTGVSDPYEAPLQPDLVVFTALDDVDHCVKQIVTELERREWL